MMSSAHTHTFTASNQTAERDRQPLQEWMCSTERMRQSSEPVTDVMMWVPQYGKKSNSMRKRWCDGRRIGREEKKNVRWRENQKFIAWMHIVLVVPVWFLCEWKAPIMNVYDVEVVRDGGKGTGWMQSIFTVVAPSYTIHILKFIRIKMK